MSFRFGIRQLAPAGESFGKEVGGDNEVVEGVDHLDDVEVWAVKPVGNSIGGEVECRLVEEVEGCVIGSRVNGVGMEEGVVGLVGAEWCEAFLVDDDFFVGGECVFFGEDAAVLYGA